MRQINTLNEWLKKNFGHKLYKLSLDGGFTCPNRDGKIGTGGCLFCSAGGSGDFAADRNKTISDQMQEAKKRVQLKIHEAHYIAYFQAFTSTYGPVSYLRTVYQEAMSDPETEILSVATRPDCLSEEVLDLLEECSHVKPVWVELGLQTIREDTAQYIRRGYPLPVFEEAVRRLSERKIPVIVHLILGLPGEEKDDWIRSVRYLNDLPVQGVKLQLLHILKGTDLAKEYEEGKVKPLTLEEYTEGVLDCLRNLRSDIVIHRITGDGPKKLLIAPLWSADKKRVLNYMNRRMEEENLCQGSALVDVPDYHP